MTSYTHSRLSCYELCPQKFKFQYIDKVESDWAALPVTIPCISRINVIPFDDLENTIYTDENFSLFFDIVIIDAKLWEIFDAPNNLTWFFSTLVKTVTVIGFGIYGTVDSTRFYIESFTNVIL